MLEWSIQNPPNSGYDLQVVVASGLGDTKVLATVRPGRSYQVPGARDVCVRRLAVPPRILITSEGEILKDTLPRSRGMRRLNRVGSKDSTQDVPRREKV
jgi:hypothetical protein